MALSEEENVCGFDDGFLVEECEAVEKIGFLVDFDDSKSENGCEDVVDNLPNDPFGMEVNMGMENDPILVDFNPSLPTDDFDIEAALAAIAGLIEDFGLKAYGFETDEADEDCGDGSSNLKAAEDEGIDDNKFFAELNFVWSSSMEYEGEDRENELVDAGPVMYVEDGTSYGDSTTMLGGGMDDLMCFGCEKYGIEHVKSESDVGVDIIIFVLEHLDLGIKDLLSIERVCRSLRDAVRKDPYLWTSIHIDYPLSQKITNEDLLRLTDRAQGKLRCLSLVKCLKISKDGLYQVLERNLEVTKLSVAGSSKLNGVDFLNNLKYFNSVAVPGIKHLRIGDPLGLTNEHLNEYKILLGIEKDVKKPSDYKPRYYCGGEIYLSLDDERTLDIEICPRCQKLGQVYDCPTENCQVKMHSMKTTETCRACISCIARCIRCGCCLDNKAYEETFCFDFLCFDCLEELVFQDGVMLPPGQTYVHQMASYHFFLYS
ncbi:F-box protein At3g27290-like [Salvia miltiorrhiza]|uniref:F-box protein At3g27290-like n=1 Tax=Salvia miltiorrhiza TaxID=226208 RepID=UPI0025AC9EC2|nr:F-box protein At3g27290-like [Salvia miltiorrhiza]